MLAEDNVPDSSSAGIVVMQFNFDHFGDPVKRLALSETDPCRVTGMYRAGLQTGGRVKHQKYFTTIHVQPAPVGIQGNLVDSKIF
jgi:hypothetical protein